MFTATATVEGPEEQRTVVTFCDYPRRPSDGDIKRMEKAAVRCFEDVFVGVDPGAVTTLVQPGLVNGYRSFAEQERMWHGAIAGSRLRGQH